MTWNKCFFKRCPTWWGLERQNFIWKEKTPSPELANSMRRWTQHTHSEKPKYTEHTGSVLRSPVPVRPGRRQPSRPALPNAPRGGERLVHRWQGWRGMFLRWQPLSHRSKQCNSTASPLCTAELWLRRARGTERDWNSPCNCCLRGLSRILSLCPFGWAAAPAPLLPAPPPAPLPPPPWRAGPEAVYAGRWRFSTARYLRSLSGV